MGILYYISLAAILSQLVLLWQVVNNFRYALSKYRKKRSYRPSAAVIVPCKGMDVSFKKNISSFFAQDYEGYRLIFVVAEQSDTAFGRLTELKEELTGSSNAASVEILVAGPARSCSQKVHNLLYAIDHLKDSTEVLAFADSDACVRTDWLSHLVYPLRQPKTGAASGYRWFIPKDKRLASLVLSTMNAKVAQLLGNTRFNQLWGGSMAIRLQTFRTLQVDKIWTKSLSDDLSLSWAVKKAGLKVAFVPACLVGSYESATWRQLFEFARRQFLITRVASPRTWLLGLAGNLLSVAGLWGGTALAVYAAHIRFQRIAVFIALPLVFFAAQLLHAILRQVMISRLLKDDWPHLRQTAAIDILFFWAWSIMLLLLILSSAFGRTIQWRGIRYKLVGPTETIVLSR